MACFNESLYIQYSISNDIVMIHIFASNIIIIAQDMQIHIIQLDIHFYVLIGPVLFNVFN